MNQNYDHTYLIRASIDIYCLLDKGLWNHTVLSCSNYYLYKEWDHDNKIPRFLFSNTPLWYWLVMFQQRAKNSKSIKGILHCKWHKRTANMLKNCVSCPRVIFEWKKMSTFSVRNLLSFPWVSPGKIKSCTWFFSFLYM